MRGWSRLPDRPSTCRRFGQLSWRDRGRLLGLAALLPIIDLGLRHRGLRQTQAWLARGQRACPPHRASPAELEDAEGLARLAAIAGRRGLYANTCLRQALAVQWWLRRRGLSAQLRIGAQRAGDTLDAHAWVELDGVPLGQTRPLPPAFPSIDIGPGV